MKIVVRTPNADSRSLDLRFSILLQKPARPASSRHAVA